MAYIKENARQTEIYGEYDVVVCGGGVAGIAAALAAVRSGVKTLLLESTYMLGGLATAGLIALYLPLCDGEGHQLSYGIAEEVLKLSIKHGGETLEFKRPSAWLNGGTQEEKRAYRYQAQYNPHVFAILAEKLLLDSGVEILYGTSVVDVNKNEDKLSAIMIETRSGRFAIKGNSFIDATGDAALYRLAHLKLEPFCYGNAFSWWYCVLVDGKNILRLRGARDIDSVNKKYKNGIDGLDAKELTKMTVSGHANILEDFLKRGEADDTHCITTIPTIPQVRMTRRICGAYEMSKNDNKKRFSDSVGMFGDWTTRGPAYELPFTALYDKSIKNLFATGRCISSHDDIWEITRVIPVCAVSGEAAGVAAAIYNDYDKVNISALQTELKAREVKIHLEEVGVKYENT